MNSMNKLFWKDEPDTLVKYPRSLNLLVKIYSFLFGIAVVLLSAALFFYLSRILGFIWLGFIIFIYSYSFYRSRHRKITINAIPEIQKRAGEQVGASTIGSAIHIAGHPFLQRDQVVVLALVGEQINIYGYDNATPLDSISLKNIQAIQTVVYDDERVPH